jgi:hypothetical protein
MTGRTLYVPAADIAEARVIAQSIAAGQCGHRPHYETREAAQAIAEHLNRLALQEGRAIRRSVFPITLRAVDDGVIANVWPADKVGDAAAALTLVAILPALAASFWGVLS